MERIYSRYKKFRVHLYVRYVYVFATDKRGIKKSKFQAEPFFFKKLKKLKKLKFQDENFGVLEVERNKKQIVIILYNL